MGNLLKPFMCTRNPCRWLVVVMTILCLTACGNESAQKAKPLEKITLAYPQTMYSALVFTALARDFFLAEGLDITPQPHEFGKVAVQSVIDGKADFAVSSDTVVMFAILNGQAVQILADTSTSKKNEAIVARKDSGIRIPQDLAGKRIGVALGTTGHFFLDSYLSANGIDKTKITIIDMKPGAMPEALSEGWVDAVAIWQPNLKQLERRLGQNGLVFYDERIYSSIVCLSSRQDFVNNHPETIKKVLRALLRAEVFFKENPDASRRQVAASLKCDQTIIDEIWPTISFGVFLDQSLLVSLEDQGRWARDNNLATGGQHPDFLNFIYFTGLQSVKPEAVRIIR